MSRWTCADKNIALHCIVSYRVVSYDVELHDDDDDDDDDDGDPRMRSRAATTLFLFLTGSNWTTSIDLGHDVLNTRNVRVFINVELSVVRLGRASTSAGRSYTGAASVDCRALIIVGIILKASGDWDTALSKLESTFSRTTIA